MPLVAESENLLRILTYGAAKTKKTLWAGTPALYGFRVLHIDADPGNSAIIFRSGLLPPEALPHIYTINIADRPNEAISCEFMTTLAKNNEVLYDEKEKKVYYTAQPGNPNVIHLRPLEFGPDTVVVFDNWTHLSESIGLRFNQDNNKDFDRSTAEIRAGGGLRDYYEWNGRVATFILKWLVTLPCHVILIGHERQYEKMRTVGNKEVLEWSRRQPVSTSNPHGQTLDSHFTECYYFLKQGSAYKIDLTGGRYEVAGSKLLPPRVYNWEDIKFGELARLAGSTIPQQPAQPFNFSQQPLRQQQAARTMQTKQTTASAKGGAPTIKSATAKPTTLKLFGNK